MANTTLTSKTYGDIVAGARVILQDNAQPYRYSDDELYEALGLAMANARRLRPDLFYSAGLDTVVGMPLSSSDSATTWPIGWEYSAPFISYVIGWAELRDDEYVDNSRAAQLLQRFTMQLTGVQA